MHLLAADRPAAQRAIITLAVIIVSAATMGACAPHDPNQCQNSYATVDEIVAELTAKDPDRQDLDQYRTYAPHLKWSFDNTQTFQKDETVYAAALPYDHRATITQNADHFTVRITGPGPDLHETQAHNAEAAGAAVAEWLRQYEHSQSQRTATMLLIDSAFEDAYNEWQPPTADAAGRPYSRRSE